MCNLCSWMKITFNANLPFNTSSLISEATSIMPVASLPQKPSFSHIQIKCDNMLLLWLPNRSELQEVQLVVAKPVPRNHNRKNFLQHSVADIIPDLPYWFAVAQWICEILQRNKEPVYYAKWEMLLVVKVWYIDKIQLTFFKWWSMWKAVG